jgi:hypothetical protein
MLLISSQNKMKIINILRRTLPRYCPDHGALEIDTEACPQCGLELLERFYPESGAHAYGLEWAVADWIKKELDIISESEIEHNFRLTFDNFFGDPIAIGSKEFSPSFVLSKCDQDYYKSRLKDFKESLVDDEDRASVDGHLYRIEIETETEFESEEIPF